MCMGVYVCMWMCWQGRLGLGRWWYRGKGRDWIDWGSFNCFLFQSKRKILQFLWAYTNLPPPVFDSFFFPPVVSACLYLALCSPSTDLNQIPMYPKSEAKRLTQSISYKYLGTWWNLNLIKGDKLFPKARWGQRGPLTTVDHSCSLRADGDAIVTPCLSQVLTESFAIAWRLQGHEHASLEPYACIGKWFRMILVLKLVFMLMTCRVLWFRILLFLF